MTRRIATLLVIACLSLAGCEADDHREQKRDEHAHETLFTSRHSTLPTRSR